LAADLTGGVEIKWIEFGFEQVAAGDAVGVESGAVAPFGDLVAGAGLELD
jgi:hypothetical protein